MMRVPDATAEVPRRRMAVVRARLEATRLHEGDATAAQAAAVGAAKRAAEIVGPMLPFQLTHAECDVAEEDGAVVATVTLQAYARAPLSPAGHLAAAAALAAVLDRHASPAGATLSIATVQDVVD